MDPRYPSTFLGSVTEVWLWELRTFSGGVWIHREQWNLKQIISCDLFNYGIPGDFPYGSYGQESYDRVSDGLGNVHGYEFEVSELLNTDPPLAVWVQQQRHVFCSSLSGNEVQTFQTSNKDWVEEGSVEDVSRTIDFLLSRLHKWQSQVELSSRARQVYSMVISGS